MIQEGAQKNRLARAAATDELRTLLADFSAPSAVKGGGPGESPHAPEILHALYRRHSGAMLP